MVKIVVDTLGADAGLEPIVTGIAKALIFMPNISMTAWIMASFVTALPGILIQLVFLPSVVQMLMKAKVIPVRYPKAAA